MAPHHARSAVAAGNRPPYPAGGLGPLGTEGPIPFAIGSLRRLHRVMGCERGRVASVTRLLEDRVAMVAGVGPGIGREIALTLSGHGASVGLLARRHESLDDVANEVEANGGRAAAVQCDITDPASCAAAVDAVTVALGPIDGLVCNASRINDGTTVLDAEPNFENWRPYFDVILFGSLTIALAVIAQMRERGQ